MRSADSRMMAALACTQKRTHTRETRENTVKFLPSILHDPSPSARSQRVHSKKRASIQVRVQMKKVRQTVGAVFEARAGELDSPRPFFVLLEPHAVLPPAISPSRGIECYRYEGPVPKIRHTGTQHLIFPEVYLSLEEPQQTIF